jgi:hypothetical protein
MLAEALAGHGAALLHRVQADDGLARLIGRDAVADRLRQLAHGEQMVMRCGADAVVIRPGLHLWARLEGERIAHITIIARRPADPQAAAALAAAHPCHRPLGELVSGRGQLPPAAPDSPLAEVAHGLAARDPDVLAVLAPLVDAMPDAVLLPRTQLALADGGWAGLAQAMGHANGRRISLPVGLHAGADGLGLVHDALALAAAPLRPFWPD